MKYTINKQRTTNDEAEYSLPSMAPGELKDDICRHDSQARRECEFAFLGVSITKSEE